MYYTYRRTVTNQLRTVFLKHFGHVRSEFQNFTMYLLTTTFLDPRTKAYILPADLIRLFAYDAVTRRSALKFLEEYQRDVLPSFEWTDFDYRAGIARLGYCQFEPELVEAVRLDRELLTDSSVERVIWDTGTLYTPAVRSRVYRKQVEEFQQKIYVPMSDEARRIADYMNSLPVNRFNRMLKNLDKAASVSVSLPLENSRAVNLEILAKVFEQPKPFYIPSDKQSTDRIFGAGQNLLGLSKEVRLALMSGLTECDLAYAQLAIVAKTWGLKKLVGYLKAGKNVWSDLLTYLDLEPYYKPILKDALYSILYGMGINNLKGFLSANLGEDKAYRFLQHGLIRYLLEARQEQCRRLRTQGFGQIATGRRIQVQSKGASGRDNIPSILAQQAQAYELILLSPVLDLAQITDAFRIVIWQHDGFTVDIEESHEEKWATRIRQVVNSKATQLGIPTHLVTTRIP